MADDDLNVEQFTETSLRRAQEYGHTAALYQGIDPQSKGGKFLVSQVEAVEQQRQEAMYDDLEPIDAGRWNGLPNWGCPFCQMTSLNRDRVREHSYRAHSRA